MTTGDLFDEPAVAWPQRGQGPKWWPVLFRKEIHFLDDEAAAWEYGTRYPGGLPEAAWIVAFGGIEESWLDEHVPGWRERSKRGDEWIAYRSTGSPS